MSRSARNYTRGIEGGKQVGRAQVRAATDVHLIPVALISQGGKGGTRGKGHSWLDCRYQYWNQMSLTPITESTC
jgi:hypothetical protein